MNILLALLGIVFSIVVLFSTFGILIAGVIKTSDTEFKNQENNKCKRNNKVIGKSCDIKNTSDKQTIYNKNNI